MKRTIKKGFTLVELLVVIAITATLLGVTVIMYSSFIDRGHESVETDTCVKMTMALKSYIMQNKVEDADDVLTALTQAELDTELESCLPNHHYYWDKSTDTIIYVDGKGNVIGYSGTYGSSENWVLIEKK